MAAEIYFYNSMGTNDKLTDFVWLKDKVFNGDDTFWEGATGECALGYANENSGSTLGIIAREKYGFMIYHRYSRANERSVTLRHGKLTGETVEADTGGNPDFYFKEYFVPKEVAWQAIEHFLKTGDRDPNLTWEIAEMPETA